jgi:hypothetical protein
MAPDVKKAIEVIGKEIVKLAQYIMDSDIGINEKVSKNTLKDSKLKSDILTNIIENDNIVINTLFNNYIVYLEWDRPPFYKKTTGIPPIKALIPWARKNGISTDNSTLYAIAYAIFRDGHKGRPILAMLDKNVDNYWNDKWANDLFESIIKELNNYFK